MRRRNLILIAFSLFAFASILYLGWRRDGPTNFEAAFQSGGAVDADLATGGYTFRGTMDNVIRVEVDPNLANYVHAEVRVTGNRAKVVVEGPSSDFHATIYVPQQTNLDVHQTIGELRVVDVKGDRSLRLNIGRIEVDVPDASQVKSVNASVRIGEVHASAWRQGRGGFFPSFRAHGKGNYSVDASVDIGQIELSN
jgi:hypothetical protein